MHVLPPGFQKIRYYGFLNNRMKRKNLKLIFTLQGHQRFKRRFTEMSMAELLKAVWDFDISICPECGHRSMKQLGRCYATS
ncbi:transposase [Mediterraneibacter gnavus]|uniref:transposase n=1 Tax=Mediterraneibacter gnavus TaxID=33038 RepID=UPI0022860D71|nr:transposase [Mediterraneibacter gnavus]MCZ0648065.1 transposase [Mediterraneibacter gnavus]